MDALLETFPIPVAHRYPHFCKVSMDGIAGPPGLSHRPNSHSVQRTTLFAVLTGRLVEFLMLKLSQIMKPFVPLYWWVALVGVKINAADS